jgi:hypothetical protein
MGLLDDAIREHLELKRRSGADSNELARLENEAFGAHQQVALDEPARFAAQEPTALHAVDEAPRPQDEPPRPHGDPAFDLPYLEPRQPPAAEEHSAPPPPPPSVSQPTEAFDPDEVRAATAAEPPEPAEEAGEEPGDEPDVLEETPEFLQETPEHDRLWFEQRPPRDFDF